MYDEQEHQEWVKAHQNADWSSLPPELSYVISPCMKHSIRVCLGEPMPISLTDEDMRELQQCAETILQNQHHPLLNQWLISGNGRNRGGRWIPAQAMVSSLLEMLDEFDFKFD